MKLKKKVNNGRKEDKNVKICLITVFQKLWHVFLSEEEEKRWVVKEFLSDIFIDSKDEDTKKLKFCGKEEMVKFFVFYPKMCFLRFSQKFQFLFRTFQKPKKKNQNFYSGI